MRAYFFAIFLISIGITATAQSDVATSKWMQTPAAIDGKLTEWNEPLNFYDADTKLFFALGNDSNAIYLCFQSKDEMSQMKLMRAGMKITLSTKGKLKHEASIVYPLVSKKSPGNGQEIEDNMKPDNSKGQHMVHDMSSFRNRFLQNHTTMQVEGFATENGEVPLHTSGISAALNWDTASNLVYEIAIPLKEFFGADYGAKNVSAADIGLSVEINALPRADAGSDDNNHTPHSGGMHSDGQEPGGRRGQFNGGGYGSGNEGTRREWSESDKVSLSTKSSFRQKFVLGKGEDVR